MVFGLSSEVREPARKSLQEVRPRSHTRDGSRHGNQSDSHKHSYDSVILQALAALVLSGASFVHGEYVKILKPLR
jgi:hypothetical protein